jgi:short-subunit dehydrogenase
MGKTHVIVTGASSGIGFAITEGLAGVADKIWAGARNTSSLQQLQNKYSAVIHPIALDVTKSEDIDSLVKQLEKEEIQTLILVNNAGIAVGGPLEVIPVEQWKSLFDVNVFGLVAMTKALLPLLRKHKGRVINVGSIAGRIATPYMAPYAASKFAVRGLTDSLRREMLPFGVPVILIEPGPIKTEIWQKSKNISLEFLKTLNPAQKEVYQGKMTRALKEVEKTERDAISVTAVVSSVLHAIQSENPKSYYLVGKNIQVAAFLARFFPSRWLDRLITGR